MLTELLKNNYRKLNTMTKYPSILTYHKLGKKGILEEELTDQYYECSDDTVLEGTEKVNGTNTRILIYGTDYIIGTREELIYSRGDRIRNDSQNILSNTIPIVEKLMAENNFFKDKLIVIYGETYGKNIGGEYKNYSTTKIGFRVFDVMVISKAEIESLLELELNQIATWRDHGNQPYIEADRLERYVHYLNLEKTPTLFKIKKSEFPTSIEEMHKFLSQYTETRVGLNRTGKSEGFVVRSNDRRYIKKVRIEEYEKTMKKMKLL